MNYRSVLDSAFAVATSLGYHPSLPDSLHRTLCEVGFPIAMITPPMVISSGSGKGVPTTCRLGVKFLSKNVLSDQDRALSISSLATHAEQFCKLLSSEPHIFSVSILEIAPVGEVLSVAGEVAVLLSADIESMECNY